MDTKRPSFELRGGDPSTPESSAGFQKISLITNSKLYKQVEQWRSTFNELIKQVQDWQRNADGDRKLEDIDTSEEFKNIAHACQGHIVELLCLCDEDGSEAAAQLKTLLTNVPINTALLSGLSAKNGWITSAIKTSMGISNLCGEQETVHRTNPLDTETSTKSAQLPLDLITLDVATTKFSVSRATLKRAIYEERIKSYRPSKAPRNAPHKVLRTEVAANWPLRR